MMRALPARAGLLLSLLLLVGCGKAKETGPVCYPTKGKVLFGGKPAAKVDVYFHPATPTNPQAPHPHAKTDANGEYQMTTRLLADGAPEGEYIATFFWPSAEDVEEPTDRLQGRYSRPEKSKNRVAVKPGVNEIPPFDLR